MWKRISEEAPPRDESFLAIGEPYKVTGTDGSVSTYRDRGMAFLDKAGKNYVFESDFNDGPVEFWMPFPKLDMHCDWFKWSDDETESGGTIDVGAHQHQDEGHEHASPSDQLPKIEGEELAQES